MIDFEPALKTLTENNVQFVIIEGLAITAHGSAYITKDLDFCYLRDESNYKNIIKALSPYHPKLRGVPDDLPFIFDEETLRKGMNFTLNTDFGEIDMLGEVAGAGDYQKISENSITMNLLGVEVKILSLEDLIKAKRAAGRTKDLLVLPELEALLELKNEGEI